MRVYTPNPKDSALGLLCDIVAAQIKYNGENGKYPTHLELSQKEYDLLSAYLTEYHSYMYDEGFDAVYGMKIIVKD
jgi:hypothetical protein